MAISCRRGCSTASSTISRSPAPRNGRSSRRSATLLPCWWSGSSLRSTWLRHLPAGPGEASGRSHAREDEPLHRLGEPVLVVRPGHRLRRFLRRRAAIPHGDAEAAAAEHGHVIVHIADGDDLGGINTAAPPPLGNGDPLVDPPPPNSSVI